LKHELEIRIRDRVKIDEMQFGFSKGKGTTGAIFIVRQLQEKYLGVKRELWLAFVDLEKAFIRVPREILWWALMELGVEEWIITVIQSMHQPQLNSIVVKVVRSRFKSECLRGQFLVHYSL
jgi:Reverse transcriptase (RNA-dependent DNA polymerase)